MKRALAAALLLICWFAPAAAYTETGEIVGHGAARCSEFLQEYARDPGAERIYFAWAQGYMSAILLSRPAGVDHDLSLRPAVFPLRKQLSFVRAYCTEQPHQGYADAVQALYLYLRKVASHLHRGT